MDDLCSTFSDPSVHCGFKRVQLETMVYRSVAIKFLYAGPSDSYCVAIEKEGEQMTPYETFVLVGAFRYASGRHTYAMRIVAEAIESKIDQLSTDDIHGLLKEIERRCRDSKVITWDTLGHEEEIVMELKRLLEEALE